ncbi:MAG: acyltransferase [Promethearchaeota archaeon]
MTEEKEDERNNSEDFDNDNTDLRLDIITSSAISRVNIKFLLIYIPILWFSGLPPVIFLYEYTKNIEHWEGWIAPILCLPLAIVAMFFLFLLSCILFSKLFLILINLIHKPKEGIFKAEIGDRDFEFWCLRTEIKKLVLWLMRGCPLPWLDVLAFRWFGVKINFSSHLNDAWVDCEFIKFGRKVMIGQGAVVMSSMVIGNYLIIKRIILDDYALIGGIATISPGTIIGKDTVIGALSHTIINQILDMEWIYFGFPAKKFKPNKYAESRTDAIRKIDVAEEEVWISSSKINIDEDKKDRA